MPTTYDFGDQKAPMIPANFYEWLRTNMDSFIPADMVYPYYMLNQYSIDTAFGGALQDLIGLKDQSLLAGEFDSTPRLALNLKYLKVTDHPMPEFVNHFMATKMNAIEESRQLIGVHGIQRLHSNPDWHLSNADERARMERAVIPNIAAMIDGNLNQNHRKTQTEAWRKASATFVEFVQRFHAYCQRAGIKYSLRHPIAMNPKTRDDLLKSSALAGIPMPETYMTKAQNEFMTQLYDAGIVEMLFAYSYAERTHALMNRSTFLHWDSIASFATAWLPDTSMLSLVPTALPPWLLSSSEHFATFYVDSFPLGTYSEQAVHHIETYPGEPLWIPPERISPHIARGLSLLCMGLTLWATQIKLGSGHRNPMWTATPMNATLVAWFVDELLYLKDKFNA